MPAYSASRFFTLGETYKGKDDDGNLLNEHLLGTRHEFKVRSTVNGQANLTGAPIIAMIVRNESGGVLGGGDVVQLAEVSGDYRMLEAVSGLSAAHYDTNCVVVDDRIAAGAVADDALFYAVINGPQNINLPAAAGWTADIVVGDKLVASAGGHIVNAVNPSTPDEDDAIATVKAIMATSLVTKAEAGNESGTLLSHVHVNI